ncbi:hypothetical protein [Azospirillum sp.]|uniref:hypothetical protein n=1 Tax=Azospirillum sp. TaxID=34012 RepID=UPI002D2FEDBB|nr:hypothetical protein [Azospirillum sp.]HYD67112.1 hypothetical protein [Azospirillum sp.]
MRSLREGQTTPNRLTDQFTVHHRGVDDHPAIEVEAGTVFDPHHPIDMGMRKGTSESADEQLPSLPLHIVLTAR